MSKRVSKNPSVHPEPVEGSRRCSWFDKLTTNGFRRLIRHPLRVSQELWDALGRARSSKHARRPPLVGASLVGARGGKVRQLTPRHFVVGRGLIKHPVSSVKHDQRCQQLCEPMRTLAGGRRVRKFLRFGEEGCLGIGEFRIPPVGRCPSTRRMSRRRDERRTLHAALTGKPVRPGPRCGSRRPPDRGE